MADACYVHDLGCADAKLSISFDILTGHDEGRAAPLGVTQSCDLAEEGGIPENLNVPSCRRLPDGSSSSSLGLCLLSWPCSWVWVDIKFSGAVYNSEQFNTAGRSIGTGLLAVDIVSHWTW